GTRGGTAHSRRGIPPAARHPCPDPAAESGPSGQVRKEPPPRGIGREIGIAARTELVVVVPAPAIVVGPPCVERDPAHRTSCGELAGGNGGPTNSQVARRRSRAQGSSLHAAAGDERE